MTTVDRRAGLEPTLDWPIPTDASAALHERASRVSPGGVQGEGRGARPYPLFMTQAQGSRIRDVDGNEFVDFHSSFGAVLLGHNDARVNTAARRAMDEHGVSFSAANPLEVELAERLVGMIPSADQVVFVGGLRQIHRMMRDHDARDQLARDQLARRASTELDQLARDQLARV